MGLRQEDAKNNARTEREFSSRDIEPGQLRTAEHNLPSQGIELVPCPSMLELTLRQGALFGFQHEKSPDHQSESLRFLGLKFTQS